VGTPGLIKAAPLYLTALLAPAGCADPLPEGGRASPSDPPAWFDEVARASGLDFVHQSGHRVRYLFPETTCGGAALFDMDGDGDLDVYLVQSGRLVEPTEERPGNRLLRNLGDGTFEDATAGSGADDRGYGISVATGDYDNDGDVDLYVTNVGPNVLLRNDGRGRFTDVTNEAGAGLAHPGWGASAAFVDYDADGDLDLFVVNYIHWTILSERDCYSAAGVPDYCNPNNYQAPARDLLYRNNGDGTFTDVTGPAGIGAGLGNGLGVVCGDFTGDSRIDIFVANDGMYNQLWVNQGDGSFRDLAFTTGCAVDQAGQAKAGMGIAALDIDDDGDLDLLVVNLQSETDSFFRNTGSFFMDETAAVGLGGVSRGFTRFGTAFVDFDNDGAVDLYEANGRVRRAAAMYTDDPYAEPNLLFRGTASGRFEEVAPRGGTATLLAHTSRAAVFGDVDNDGGVDILVVNRDAAAYLLRNVVRDRGHWVLLRVLEENGRNALGATVTLSVEGRRVTRDVRTAYSYAAANDPRVHVGLGTATAVTQVTVRWPGGATESFGSFEADQVITLRHGEGGSSERRGH